MHLPASYRIPPTPTIALQLEPDHPVIWCKLEFLNPSGSTKDRIARFILEKAWREGRLTRDHLVVEASSGSTSIAMALACAQLGVRFLAIMPEGVSNERTLMIRAFGGDIRLTSKEGGVLESIHETERIAAETLAFLPCQFANEDNALAHRMGTAREMVDQIPSGHVDAVVSGVGTGGSLVGLFDGLRDCGCAVTPVLAKPVALSSDLECCSFSGRIPGVVDRISKIFREDRLPGLLTIEVQDEEALETARQLLRRGLPVGPSSGLNYRAALDVARRLGPHATVATVFPDRMERYFTTDLFRPFR